MGLASHPATSPWRSSSPGSSTRAPPCPALARLVTGPGRAQWTERLGPQHLLGHLDRPQHPAWAPKGKNHPVETRGQIQEALLAGESRGWLTTAERVFHVTLFPVKSESGPPLCVRVHCMDGMHTQECTCDWGK